MRNSGARGALAALLLLAGALLGGCSSKHTNTNVGVGGLGVVLSSANGSTLIYQGATLEIDATVSNDPKGAGVTWSLAGVGSLASTTPTKAVYQSPNGFSGSVTVTLVATAISDTAQTAAVTITVNGLPSIAQPVLFPANQNISYAAFITVAGGLSPFAWTITDGTLPSGLTTDASTGPTLTISGTPSTLGSSTVTLQVTDSNQAKATVTVTIKVNPQTACLLSGPYAYLFTGFHSGLPVARAGSFSVATTGTVSGEQDFKDAQRARIGESISTGKCTTLTQNRGILLLQPTGISESFDFATVSSLEAGQLQQDDGSGIVGSAQFVQQDPTAFTSAAVAGDYALFLVGDDGARRRLTVAGRLTLGADGSVSGGQGDSSGSQAATAAALTGSFTAPDANGRGTATLSLAGLALPLAYYVVNNQLAYLVSADSTVTTPRLAGRMSRQSGAGAFAASSLGSSSVLSLWGSSYAAGVPVATMTAGRLANVTAAAGTLDVLIDVANPGTFSVNQAFLASSYSIAANGRGSVAFGTGTAARDFVLYLDGPGSGYVLEPGSAVGNVGVLDRQVGLPFTDFAASYYVGGTVFAGSTSPITLAPQLLLQNGAISGNVTGSYALDPTTGRILATVSRNVLGGTGLIMYLTSTGKIVVLGDGENSVNSSLAWLRSY